MSDTTNRLSRRQLECLAGVAALKSSKQIAVELGISPKTVDNYIAEAVTALGATNRRDAASMLAAGVDPDKSHVQSPRVEEGPGPEPVTASLPQPVTRTSMRDFSFLTGPKRVLLILVGSLIVVLAIGVSVVAAVGMIAIYERAGNDR